MHTSTGTLSWPYLFAMWLFPFLQIIFATYVYYVSKIVDLLDTVIISNRRVNECSSSRIHHRYVDLHLQVFFVLRKKNNQISFLHVYHHAGMVLACFVYFKFLCGQWRRTNGELHKCNSLCIITNLKFCANHSSIYRKSRHTARRYKCICSRGHVQLLLHDIVSTWVEKFHVVEKAYHTNPTGKRHDLEQSGIFEMQMFRF